MKNIFKPLAIAACTFLLAGCDNYDDRYTPEYGSVARLEVYGEQDMTAWTINDVEVYTIKVLRSGHSMDTPAAVTARTMTDEEWSSYAATYGLKRFHKIPENCYSFLESDIHSQKTMEFGPREFVNEASVELYCDLLKKFDATLPAPEVEGDDNANIICLPVVLEAAQGSVLSTQSTLILKIISREAGLILEDTGYSKVSCLATAEPIVRKYTISLSCDNPWGFTVNVSNSQDILDSYNAENNTRYVLMGEAAEVLENGEWIPWSDKVLEFPAGKNSIDLNVRFNPAKAGMMDAFALKVDNPSLNILAEGLTSIVALQVKPSATRLKIDTGNITASSDDGTHTAKNLVDGKRNTYYSSNPQVHDGDPVYGSYVDFKLTSAIRYFSFDYMTRFDYFGNGEGIPNEVHIYTSENGSDWELCGTINNMRRDFNGRSQTENYGNFDAGKEITYIRWAVVLGGATGTLDLREANTTAHWTATALYLYGK